MFLGILLVHPHSPWFQRICHPGPEEKIRARGPATVLSRDAKAVSKLELGSTIPDGEIVATDENGTSFSAASGVSEATDSADPIRIFDVRCSGDWQFIHCGIESLNDERAAAAGHCNQSTLGDRE
jgi:hypothetical protein